MGHLITANGLKPDLAKLEAIAQMPQPDNKKAVQRLIGMVSYLKKFARGMSNIIQPLRDLTKTDSDFLWEESVHRAAFKKIKQMLSQAPILSYYDPALALTLQWDMSEGGLGACILQNEQPIAYAFRALTDAEGTYRKFSICSHGLNYNSV